MKWWKGIFNDLKPYDNMSMDSVLDRYHRGMKSFDEYQGYYDEGYFFVNIHESQLKYNELYNYHKKYNSPTCDTKNFNLHGNYYEPVKKIGYSLRQHKNFDKAEYHSTLKFKGQTSNYNGRDGQIRGGFATPSLYEYYYKPKVDKKITGEWIYQEIPHSLIYNNLKTTTNRADIEYSKQFVKEVTSTIGWDNIDEVKKIVEQYDNKYPDWSHDFPINGFMQMRKEGILFPAVWTFFRKLVYHSFHRMIMTSFNEMNFPFIIPVPYGMRKWTGQSLEPNFYNEGSFKYLNFHFNLDTKITEFEFSNKKLSNG